MSEVTRNEFEMYQKHQSERFDALMSRLVESVELQRKANDRFDQRLNMIEKGSGPKASNDKVWKARWFEYLIRGLVFLAILITASAVARDLLIDIVTRVIEGGIVP